jgi:hypothetical protein
MLKGYVADWKYRERPERHILDVGFDGHPENAASWKTKEEAEEQCVMLDSKGIEIRSSEGGTHICKGFRVEERRQGEFDIVEGFRRRDRQSLKRDET